MKDIQIRVSTRFKEMIDYIRAKYLLHYSYCPSTAEICEKIIEMYKINREEIWQNEINKK